MMYDTHSFSDKFPHILSKAKTTKKTANLVTTRSTHPQQPKMESGSDILRILPHNGRPVHDQLPEGRLHQPRQGPKSNQKSDFA